MKETLAEVYGENVESTVLFQKLIEEKMRKGYIRFEQHDEQDWHNRPMLK